MRWKDTPTGYGWLSIALHWSTAIVILALWFIGSSIHSTDNYAHLLHLHTTVAASAYLLLWLRVVWRFKVKHPGPLPKQKGPFFLIGKYVHYVLLVAVAVMLISGPIMAWSEGDPIYVFALAIPSPLGIQPGLRTLTHEIHVAGAAVVISCVGLHILGVFKHAMFNRDGTFDKMMIASKAPDSPELGAKPGVDG